LIWFETVGVAVQISHPVDCRIIPRSNRLL
jgi:hypothetical protein